MTAQYGRYRIIKELGKGTMGVVFQAHDPQIDRMVALKVLRPDRVTSEAFVARFLKEARAIGRLSHPNIVTIYDVGEDQGTIYIAMEYLKGEPFNDVVRSQRLPLPMCIDIARQVALTLDYAHRQGIVHRDIKPSNIIFTEEKQVKLTDFGIARIEDTGAGHQTQAGEILGTPVYMAPEQVMGQGVDGRSDLFSLGVILYEIVVGRRPFAGSNIAAIFRAITNDNPESPATADPFIPKMLSDLILKSLAKQPEARFQTGREMAEALTSILPAVEDKTVKAIGRAPNKKIVLAVATLVLIVIALTGGYLFWPRPASHTAGGTATEATPAPDNAGGAAATDNTATHPVTQVTPEQLALLKISSEPQGAKVFVNNGLKGLTPLVVPLPLGKYELRLNLTGYLEWEAQVELEAGETPVSVAMRRIE
ncbi:MAG: serine/threonine protein kinase [Desulfobacteraceae bacterium]|nr:serine/threonine protein kinase [Desulfobacteraceae bacterium]